MPFRKVAEPKIEVIRKGEYLETACWHATSVTAGTLSPAADITGYDLIGVVVRADTNHPIEFHVYIEYYTGLWGRHTSITCPDTTAKAQDIMKSGKSIKFMTDKDTTAYAYVLAKWLS